LTLSKLDARLLIIVPEQVNIPSLMQQLNHIYETELKSAGIESSIDIDQSYRDMQLYEVMVDPGRLLQVSKLSKSHHARLQP
jgi:signal transduction histidine kinase